uniref:FI15716p1 n=1 Tax=Drosophila melanogaster TaxID=7227 RepID=G2J5Z7_DROME
MRCRLIRNANDCKVYAIWTLPIKLNINTLIYPWKSRSFKHANVISIYEHTSCVSGFINFPASN